MVEQLRSISRKVVVEKEKLKREIGVAALFSAGYGNVGSSIYYALGATAVFALGAAPLAIALAGIFFIFTVWTFSEGATMMPYAGGSSHFVRKAFNESTSFFTAWIHLLTYIVTISISAYTAAKYLAYFVPFISKPIPISIGEVSFATNPHFAAILVASLFIVALMFLNAVGVKEATAFNIFFALVDILTQLLMIVIGFTLMLNIPKMLEYPSMGVEYWPSMKGFIYGFALAMISYTGIGTISQMAEETEDYKNKIPKSYLMLIVVVLVMSVGLPLVANSVMSPGELAGHWKEDPIAGIAHYMPDLQFFGMTLPLSKIFGPWVSILAVSILLMAANAGIMGVSRLAYAMGEHRQLPAFVFKLHRKFNTPYKAIYIFSGVAILLLVLGVFSKGIFIKLANLYAFTAMIIFGMTHLAIIVLRVKQPDAERPYKIRWNIKIKGKEIPITTVIGFLMNLIVFVIIATGEPWTRMVGIAWIIVGLIMYYMYRKKHELPIHEEVTIERVVEAAYMPVNFYDIIVPTVGELKADMMQAACKIALQDKSKILAIYVIEVPMTLEVNAAIPVEKEKGELALDQAEMIAKEYGVAIDTKLIQTRTAGKAIVEEIKKRKTDLVMMGQPNKTESSEMLSGKTVSYVSKHAPCKVWINISEKE